MDAILPKDILYGDILPDGLPRILPPYENGIFQAVLTLPEAHEALVGVVAAILDRPVRTVALRNNDAPTRDKLAKREEYDINCVVDAEDGDQFSFEMQASPMAGDNKENNHRNIKWRSVFNLCDLHVNQPGRGLHYGDFVRSYQVMFCNYKVFDFENELSERFMFRNQKGIELCDAVMAIFVDLTKAREIAKKPVGEMSDIEGWVVFFALGNDPIYSKVIAEITKVKEGIALARDTLLTISQNADERARFRSRRIWLQDREHEQAVARKEGRAEGHAEGLAEGRAEARAEYELLLESMTVEIAALRAKLGEGQ